MMLTRSALTRPRHKNRGRPAEKSARAYSQWLRGRECACHGANPDCSGRMQAAHVPHPQSSGMGTKAKDAYQIPLSEGCHIFTQHRIGWPAFAKKFLHGVNPTILAEAYYREWPGRIAHERKLADAR